MSNLNYIPFVLLTSPRSGSHMLRSALMQHPGVVMHGEMFNQSLAHCLPYTLGTDPATILNNHVYHPYPEEIKAVGFVLHDYQHFYTPNPYWKDLYSTLNTIENLKVIRLFRENLAVKFVSNVIAQLSNEWNWYHRKPEKVKQLRVKIAPVEFEKYFQSYQENSANIEKRINGYEWYQTSYESLIADFDNITQEMQTFLDLEPRTIRPATHKQNTRPLPEMLDNYEENRRYFEHTKHAVFFQ